MLKKLPKSYVKYLTKIYNAALSMGYFPDSFKMVRRFRFEPIAIETSGVYGPSACVIVQEIGKKISQISGDKRESMWLKQRLSIAIQRGNALSILSLANHMTGYV